MTAQFARFGPESPVCCNGGIETTKDFFDRRRVDIVEKRIRGDKRRQKEDNLAAQTAPLSPWPCDLRATMEHNNQKRQHDEGRFQRSSHGALEKGNGSKS